MTKLIKSLKMEKQNLEIGKAEQVFTILWVHKELLQTLLAKTLKEQNFLQSNVIAQMTIDKGDLDSTVKMQGKLIDSMKIEMTELRQKHMRAQQDFDVLCLRQSDDDLKFIKD